MTDDDESLIKYIRPKNTQFGEGDQNRGIINLKNRMINKVNHNLKGIFRRTSEIW